MKGKDSSESRKGLYLVCLPTTSTVSKYTIPKITCQVVERHPGEL